jgi:hypothetical protein
LSRLGTPLPQVTTTRLTRFQQGAPETRLELFALLTRTASKQGFTMTKQMNKEPYQQAYYPPTPTSITKYMRNNILWQLVRFAVINFKMLKLMRKSH